MKRVALIVVVVMVCGVLLAWALSAKDARPADSGSPVEATLSPTPAARPELVGDPIQQAADDAVEAAHQVEGQTNPVLRSLPYTNPYFRLDFAGSEGDRYRLEAEVYYVPGQDDPAAKIEQQKPYVLKFLRDIGQPDGTYVVVYVARSIEDTQGDS